MKKRLVKETTELGLIQVYDCPVYVSDKYFFEKKLDNDCLIVLGFTDSYPFSNPNIFVKEKHHLIRNKDILISHVTKMFKHGILWIDLFSHWSPQCTIKAVIDEAKVSLDMMIEIEQKKRDAFLRQMFMRELIDIYFPHDVFVLLFYLLK